MSRTAATTNTASPVSMWDKAMSTGNWVPSRRRPRSNRSVPHRPIPGVADVVLPVHPVSRPQRLRHQYLDGLADNVIALVAEQRLGLAIDEPDHTVLVHPHQGIGGSLQQALEVGHLRRHLLSLRAPRQTRTMSRTPLPAPLFPRLGDGQPAVKPAVAREGGPGHHGPPPTLVKRRQRHQEHPPAGLTELLLAPLGSDGAPGSRQRQSGPRALSAKAPELDDASLDEPSDSRSTTQTPGMPTPTSSSPLPGPDSGRTVVTKMSWACQVRRRSVHPVQGFTMRERQVPPCHPL